MRNPVQIYQGEITDCHPGIHSAGKLFPDGETVSGCLTEIYPRLITPPVVQKFLNTRRPDPGAQTVFYGKANDPNVEKHMTHGVSTRTSLSAGSLINPRPKSLFQQKLNERNESLYFRHQWKPLGRSHDQTTAFPAFIDPNKITFGKAIKRGLSAGAVFNPPKSFQEIDEESKKGHELYVVTHNEYNVGERRHRKYDPTKFQKDKRFGLETPHFNDGRNVRNSIQWLLEKKRNGGANIVSKRLDDFRERTQPQIGKVLDPNASTRNLPPNHTFGALLPPEKHGVGDLLQYRSSKNFLRGKDKHRAILASVQQRLKKLNYKNFGSLLEAFRHYDKNCDGKIDKDELKNTCSQFGVELDHKILDSLLEYCDVDKDGLINFVEFANFLNWKDKMSIAKLEEKILTQGTSKLEKNADPLLQNQERLAQGLLKPGELVFKEGIGTGKTPVTLSKDDDVKGFYGTSSSKINAVMGGPSSACYRTSGIPSIRTDIPPPRIRRIGDRHNYGDQSDAYGLLCPSVFSQNMVFERDFIKPRSKEEMSQILHNMGVDISSEKFDQLWDMASNSHPKGEVSVETVRNALTQTSGQTSYLEH